MGRVTFACKVCGAPSPRLLTLDNDNGHPRLLDVALCPECGLLFVGTPVTPEQLEAAYARVDWAGFYERVEVPDRAKAARSAEDLRSALGPGRAVLDVGCGCGFLLEELKRRHPAARVVGHELPGPLADSLRHRGFEVHDCDLDRVPDSFAVVTLLDVAEHLLDPVAMFRAIARRVEDGGRIYLHTPRRSFWDGCALLLARLPVLWRLAAVWIRMRVNLFHLQLWSDEALVRALERAGFEVERFERQLELSWPLEMYVRVYLEKRLGMPRFVGRLATRVADLVLVRARTMRNKAVVLARRPAAPDHPVDVPEDAPQGVTA